MAAAAASTRSRVALATRSGRLKAYETTAVETPAARATSRAVGGLPLILLND
jgi:hypothetical protein